MSSINNKETANTEKIIKRQKRQFIFVYIFGLIAFIVMVLVLEGDLFKNKKETLDLNNKVLETPDILKIDDTKEQGRELNDLFSPYKVFIEEVDNLNLNQISSSSFEYEEEEFKYVDSNYTYLASDNSIKLTRKGQNIYSCSIENDVVKATLYGEKEYYLEYSFNELAFKVDNKEYFIKIENDKYFVKCSYFDSDYSILNEIYDSEWNFINIEAIDDNNIGFTGYFFEDLEGYSYNKDTKKIINENNLDEDINSTEYLDDSKTIYYTIVEFQIENNQKKELLLVNNNREFPLN